MKKIFLLLLCCFLLSTTTFGNAAKNVLLERRNYIVEKHSEPLLLLPSGILGFGSYWLWTASEKTEQPYRDGMKFMSVGLALGSLLFLYYGLVPKKTFLLPKLGEDGKTIWFEKQIKW